MLLPPIVTASGVAPLAKRATAFKSAGGGSPCGLAVVTMICDFRVRRPLRTAGRTYSGVF